MGLDRGDVAAVLTGAGSVDPAGSSNSTDSADFTGTPPAASPTFVLLAALYAASMFWAAVVAAQSGSPNLGAVAAVGGAVAVGLAVGAVSLVVAADLRSGEDGNSAGSNDGQVERRVVLVALPSMLFIVAYVLATRTLWGDTTTAVLVQATLLLLLFGTYTRQYVPAEIDDITDDAALVEALDRHMEDWWGFTQLSTSIMLAFGVGVAAGLLQSGSNVGSADFVRLAVTTFVGVAALWAYVFHKIRAVGHRRRNPAPGDE